jgi:hypothetical protein
MLRWYQADDSNPLDPACPDADNPPDSIPPGKISMSTGINTAAGETVLLLSRSELALLTASFVKGQVALQTDERFRDKHLGTPEQIKALESLFGTLMQCSIDAFSTGTEDACSTRPVPRSRRVAQAAA